MYLLHICFVVLFFKHVYCLKNIANRRNYLDLHCQDNEFKPVDWWYIYKPPVDSFPLQDGLNFSYITSETAGRWYPSQVSINSNSMLSNTLQPLYQPMYLDVLAVAVYQSREKKSSRTAARGILAATETGGFLLTHSIPDFPNLYSSEPEILPDEAENGHLLVCVSLNLDSINKVAESLQKIVPKFTYIKIPQELKTWLPEWKFQSTVKSLVSYSVLPFIDLNITGTDGATIVYRPPGTKTCLYGAFAERQSVYLNVYGNPGNNYFLSSFCNRNFGVRNIDTISIKYRESVYYIDKDFDHIWFAVSTAAPWQQRGSGPSQYWTCTSNVDKEDRFHEAGMLLCVNKYEIWRTFDNLKVKEPVC